MTKKQQPQSEIDLEVIADIITSQIKRNIKKKLQRKRIKLLKKNLNVNSK